MTPLTLVHNEILATYAYGASAIEQRRLKLRELGVDQPIYGIILDCARKCAMATTEDSETVLLRVLDNAIRQVCEDKLDLEALRLRELRRAGAYAGCRRL